MAASRAAAHSENLMLNWRADVDRKLSGFVYLAQCAKHGVLKIGYSCDPIKRVKALKYGTGSRVILVSVIEGGLWLERDLHHQFKAMRLIFDNEWYADEPAIRAYFSERGGNQMAIEMLAAGKSKAAIAQAFGCSVGGVYNWIKRQRDAAIAVASPLDDII